MIEKNDQTDNLHARVQQELSAIYSELNDFDCDLSFGDLMTIFTRNNRPTVLTDEQDIIPSGKAEEELFFSALQFVEFLVMTNDFECLCTREIYESICDTNTVTESIFLVTEFTKFKHLVKQVSELYGYESLEVEYNFFIRRKGEETVTPPECIPDEILELFQPKEST